MLCRLLYLENCPSIDKPRAHNRSFKSTAVSHYTIALQGASPICSTKNHVCTYLQKYLLKYYDERGKNL